VTDFGAFRAAGTPCLFNGYYWAVPQEFPMEKPRQHVENERKRIETEEDQVTVNSDESFPASDPPSFNPGVTGAADVKRKKPTSQH
jgi:hypothetical protein